MDVFTPQCFQAFALLNNMPIRFFCEHCVQMLKIGTSKVGSVVDCPRCQKSVVVPPQSSPLAEESYRKLKSLRHQHTAPPAENDTAPIPTRQGLEEEIDDADMPLWMEEAWMPSQADSQGFYQASRAPPVLAEEIAIQKQKKQHNLLVTLLSVSLVIIFFVGITFGILIRGSDIQSPRAGQQADGLDTKNEVTGTLYYINENGERRGDADAVIICLPKDRQPASLLSCKGLRPEDTVNKDTVQIIHEMGGMYERADANGTFAFPYKEGERYFVILISAHQRRTGGEMKPSVEQELRRYFRDPDQFGEGYMSIDEHEWGKPTLRYTFELTD